MIDRIVTLVSALREELQQYGEMLALLDRQQQQVIARAADEVFQTIGLIKSQGVAIQTARDHREDCRAQVAQTLQQPEAAPFSDLIPLFPPDYQPLIQALVEENNELLVRVRQRARQNHLLLSRSLDLMQGLINSLFPGRETRVYTGQGTSHLSGGIQRPMYEAVG
jgi:flagellar biosynthesis/type III secretory pathway chaperone